MIKENRKHTKYNFKKNKKEIFIEYLKTILFSALFAILITSFLTIKARNEMIEDVSANTQQQKLLDKKIAMDIITKTDLLDNLKNKTYSVCMYAGEICEVANDYKDAQMAYELAIQKAKIKTYNPYYHLICVLVAQEKFQEAETVLENILDATSKSLIKFKTRSYLTIGDKYYSIGKFLSAAKAYEKACFYYDKFTKKDNKIEASIQNRITNSYIQVADIMVKSGLNSEAIKFLKKAEEREPNNFEVKYKLAIVLSDSDPENSVEYLDQLLKEIPQKIDYGVYNRALMKAANIADLDNRATQAKYYRYKIYSIDMFVNRKVVYKNDIDINIKNITTQKTFFNYPIKVVYEFFNNSNRDMINLKGDFVLCFNDLPIETITVNIADKKTPLHVNSDKSKEVNLKFKRKVYTKKELENFTIKIYLYKDAKYKTLVFENKIIPKS